MFLKIKSGRFLEELGYNTTLRSLGAYIMKNGWNLVYYNTASGDEILRSVNITEVSRKKGFIKESERIIFVNGNLPEKEKRLVIIHELAHIILKHSQSFKGTRQKEKEARKFAEYVTHARYLQLFGILRKPALILLIVILSAMNSSVTKKTPAGNAAAVHIKTPQTVYVTPTGSKYHAEDCYFLNENKIETDIETAKKSYAPCKVCIKRAD